MRISRSSKLVAVVTFLVCIEERGKADAFAPCNHLSHVTNRRNEITLLPRLQTPILEATSSEDDSTPNDDNHEESEEPKLITREMLQRALLEDPAAKVRRKKRNGSHYRVLDNRDALPFTVKVMTPDPYTKPAQKKLEASKNTKKSAKRIQRRSDLAAGGIASSLYAQTRDGSLEKILGQFQLDKSTNCGDIVEVGDHEYEVVKARCQYKYAGGKQFIMVRKILEVKEITRIAQENYLIRQFQKGEDRGNSI